MVNSTAPELQGQGLVGKNPKGAGRKPVPLSEKIVVKHVGLTPAAWTFLEKLKPGANASGQVVELVDRARKFLPEGKLPAPVQPGKVRLSSAPARYAKREGITKEEAINRAWEVFERWQQEQGGG